MNEEDNYSIIGCFIMVFDRLEVTRCPGDIGRGVEFDHELLCQYWRN